MKSAASKGGNGSYLLLMVSNMRGLVCVHSLCYIPVVGKTAKIFWLLLVKILLEACWNFLHS